MTQQETEARERGLPVAVFEPEPVPEPGQRYVQCRGRVWAFDPVDRRVYLAAVPGQWCREAYAKALGVAGEPIELSVRPT